MTLKADISTSFGHDRDGKCNATSYVAADWLKGYHASANDKQGSEGSLVVKISTSKTTRGVDSHATCILLDKSSTGFVSETFVIFGDYSQSIARYPTLRCTAKNIASAHGEALREWPSVVMRIFKHYGISLDRLDDALRALSA